MMGMNKAKESGVYVGLNYARSEWIQVLRLIGYRFNDRYENIPASHYDDNIISIEGDFQFLSLIFQAHYDKWQPYVRLALGGYLNDSSGGRLRR